MSYVSHHVAEIMRPVCIPTDLEIIIQADSKKKSLMGSQHKAIQI